MSSASFQPTWLDHAWADLGVLERSGDANNPRVLAYYRDSGHPDIRSEEVAWCAAFVGACLARASVKPTGSLMARSYLDWGVAVDAPRLGAIAILSRGDDPSLGHVGFVVGINGNQLLLLGGNQSDAVRIEAFTTDRLLGLRWPTTTATITSIGSPTPIFDTALAHVLEMEGGWTDDPVDPGGPTNLGITLATYAAHKNLTLASTNAETLKAELRALPLATARDIYFAHYWKPCFAAQLPPALALMHFDAAVNHGVGGAAKLLQQALGVTIDGEIGPETLAAARSNPLDWSLDTYAALRLERYRSLPHFWRFGRGWTRRVEVTLALARTQRGAVPPTPTLPPQQKAKPMTDITPASTDTATTAPKWWGESLTIWGTIVTTLSTVLPVVGPLIGLDVTGEMVRDLGQNLTQLVQALGGVIGIIMTIAGRLRAVQPLIRRDVVIKM
jgi:uncharacterized protein (TIGR02594 family)